MSKYESCPRDDYHQLVLTQQPVCARAILQPSRPSLRVSSSQVTCKGASMTTDCPMSTVLLFATDSSLAPWRVQSISAESR